MRKTLYIIYIPFLALEWAVDMIIRTTKTFHECIKELTISIKSTINEPPVRTESD